MDYLVLLFLLAGYVSLNLVLVSFNSIHSALSLNVFLGLLFTRPNILGETFGYIQPIFWLFVYLLSRQISQSYPGEMEEKSNHRKISKAIMAPIFTFYFSFWTYTIAIDLQRGNNVSLWVLFSNTVGLATALVAVSRLIIYVGVSQIIKVYCWYLLVPALGGIGKVILPSVFSCSLVSFQRFGGRSWSYDVCTNGGIFLGNRFTGYGGEPAIFATQLALGVFLLLNVRVYRRITSFCFILVLSTAIIISYATTGYVALAIAIFTSILNITSKRIKVFSGLLFISSIYPVYEFSTALFARKLEANSASITDRFLYTSIRDYFQIWISNPLGIQTPQSFQYSGINLLSLSVLYGVPIIVFTFVFSVQIFARLRKLIPWNGPLYIILFTMIFSQPPITNYLWFILLYLILGLQVSSSTEMSKSK